MASPSSGLSGLVHLDAQIREEANYTYVTHQFYGWQQQPGRKYVWRRTYRPIAHGGFGDVFLEECQAGGTVGSVRAVKRIQKTTSGNSRPINYGNELEAIARLSHSGYARYFVRSDGWYEDECAIYITMEYLQHGDLQRYVGCGLPEVQVRLLISQVLQGLKCMHELGYVHRDLKPSNLLVVNQGPAWQIKIADFGLSKNIMEHASSLRTVAGTRGYMAPELLGLLYDDYDDDEADRMHEAEEEARQRYTNAVDIWAVGAIAFYLLSGTVPFSTVDLRALRRYVSGRISLPSEAISSRNISSPCRHFIANLMAANPQSRPTAEGCLDLQWLKTTRNPTALTPTPTPTSTLRVPATDRLDIASSASASWTTTTDSGYRTVTTSRISRSAIPTAHSDTNSPTASFRGHSSPIRSSAVAHDTDRLATSSIDNQIVLWSLDSGAGVRSLDMSGSRSTDAESSLQIKMVAISPDGRHLACTSTDGRLRLWDSTTMAKAKVFGPRADVRRKMRGDISTSGHVCLAFSPDGLTLASGMTERRTRTNWSGGVVDLLAVEDGKHIRTLRGYKGNYIWVDVHGVNTNRTIHRPHEHDIESLTFSPNGVSLLSAGPGRCITVFKVKKGKKERSLDCLGLNYDDRHHVEREGGTKLVKFSKDGRFLATAHTGRSLVALWDTSNWKVVQKVGDDTKFWHSPPGLDVSFVGGLVTFTFSPRDDILAVKTPDHVYIYDIVRQRMIKKFEYGKNSQIPVLAFSKDGRGLVTDGQDGKQIQFLRWESMRDVVDLRRSS